MDAIIHAIREYEAFWTVKKMFCLSWKFKLRSERTFLLGTAHSGREYSGHIHLNFWTIYFQPLSSWSLPISMAILSTCTPSPLPRDNGLAWKLFHKNGNSEVIVWYSPIRLMYHRIMVQFGYWFRFWPVPSQYFLCKICWLMVQSAYWFNFWSVPTWSH